MDGASRITVDPGDRYSPNRFQDKLKHPVVSRYLIEFWNKIGGKRGLTPNPIVISAVWNAQVVSNCFAWKIQGLEDKGKIISVISLKRPVLLFYLIHWRSVMDELKCPYLPWLGFVLFHEFSQGRFPDFPLSPDLYCPEIVHVFPFVCNEHDDGLPRYTQNPCCFAGGKFPFVNIHLSPSDIFSSNILLNH